MTSSAPKDYKTRSSHDRFDPTPLERRSTSRSNENQELVARAFALAHFLIPDRAAAIQILTCAINKVKAKVGREHKRAYWRDKFLKRQITRVTREDEDTLQWLIYFESDTPEREQEAQGLASVDDMVVRYIKSLIRISTGMCSFYVNVAVHRVLHCYSTAETQEIYEMVADSYRGADAYRRAKRLLMLKLESRFGGKLRIVTVDHGEARYELADDPGRFYELARQCLRLFTPWSTLGKCPLRNYSGASSYELHESFRRDFNSGSDQDKIEISRCHAFIDPSCLGHLARALGLEEHTSKLGIPRFYMDFDRNTRPPLSRLPETNLTDQERRSIEAALDEEEARRKRVVARAITFVVDGVESAGLDIEHEGEFQVDIPFGAKLIELWTRDEHGPLLLATHFMPTSGFAEFSLQLRDDRTLLVTVERGDEEAGACKIAVSVGGKRRESPISGILRWMARPLAIPAYAVAALMLLAVTLLWTGYQRGGKNERARTDELKGKVTQKLAASTASEPLAASATSYRLTPDDDIIRGSGQIEEHAIVVPRAPVVIKLELPVAAAGGRYRVSLRPTEGRETILVEDNLLPVKRGSAVELTFSLPSTMLAPSRNYRVELREMAHPDGLRTFTFYTAPPQP